MFAKICLLVVVLPLIYADTCLGPTVDAKTYTSVDALVAAKTAFIVEFSLKCKNGLKDLNLFALVDDQTYPVVRSKSGGYQVSWSVAENAVQSGKYDVQIFDDDGYASLRKAQRSGSETAGLKPLTSISFEHKAAWGGPIVSSEFIAITVALVLLYFAHSAKSTIQQ